MLLNFLSQTGRALCVSASVFFSLFCVDALALTRAEQRLEFTAALASLKAGDRGDFFTREARLRNYVLHPHLRYALALDHVERSAWPDARAAVLHFARAQPSSAQAASLVRRARFRLRDDNNWRGVLDSRAWPGAHDMPCLELRARVALGEQQTLAESDRERWTNINWSADCEAGFTALLANNAVGGADLWARIAALMDRGRLEGARAFFPQLSNADDALLTLWIAGHNDPEAHVNDPLIRGNTAFNRNMARHFISRWARRDPLAAARQIARFVKAGRYDPDTYGDMLRTVSVRAAVDYRPQASKLLNALPANRHDAKSRAWQVRSALRAGDWTAVRRHIGAMPDAERADGAWRFWHAIAAQKSGDTKAGEAALRALARTRSYYGFLAADAIGERYNLEIEATPRDSGLRARLQARRDVQTAREYWAVGLDEWAQRSWTGLYRTLSKTEFTELVTIASDWGWHDRAIAGNANTSYSADLPLRFPFAFEESVAAQARAQRLDPSWVFAVARRESGFRPAVRSGVGALGVMQLMPATARAVARERGEPRTGSLLDPARNIQLGTHYLAQLHQRFKGSAALASAGYNAGPSRIARWSTDSWVAGAGLDTARWVETLPVDETRNYVQAVMAYATVYDWLANRRIDVPLTRRLGAVPRFD